MSKTEPSRTWLCCHTCRWIESATYQEPTKINTDGFCLKCGEPACDPFDPDFPYNQYNAGQSPFTATEGREDE